jgi:hypothetical protein
MWQHLPWVEAGGSKGNRAKNYFIDSPTAGHELHTRTAEQMQIPPPLRKILKHIRDWILSQLVTPQEDMPQEIRLI